MNSISLRLVETGLIQFGRFWEKGVVFPFRISLNYLPAYPEILALLAQEVKKQIPATERLIVNFDTMPLGIALSLQSQISLIYSRGQGELPAHDLVGAYNAGHSAVLLVNVFGSYYSLTPLISSCQQVGLSVKGVVALINLEISRPPDLPIYSVLRLADIADELAASGYLPPGQKQAVSDWIVDQAKRPAIHHPNAAGP